MKLLSLYIDNFGKISDYKYDFNDKLNTIYEENGWGKTTLTVFIKAMLYGLDKSERQKYTPWKNLTSFGGSLVISVGKDEYRIERSFSPKRASSDILKVYDLKTGLEKKFDANLGEYFLNLNMDSFERSVFIPEHDLSSGFGSDIEAKLANLIGGTNDSQSFDDAVELLKNRAHELKLNSKKGLIIDKKKELFEIENELDLASDKFESLPNLERNRDSLVKELDFITKERKDTQDKIIESSKNQEKRAKLDLIEKFDEDIAIAEKNLSDNNQVFNGVVVTADEVLDIRSKNKKLESLRLEYEVLKKNIKVPIKYESLSKDMNESNFPDDAKISYISGMVDKYNNIKSVVMAHSIVPKKKKPIVGITLTILASVMLVAGIALMLLKIFNLFNYWIPSIALGVASIFAFLGAIAGFLVNNAKNQDKLVGGNVKAYDFELRETEVILREFFSKYHLYTSDFSNNLYIVRSNMEKYKEARAEYDEVMKANSTLENRIKSLDNEIMHFLNQFKSSPNLTVEERIGELNTHIRNQEMLFMNLMEKRDAKAFYIKSNGLDNITEVTENIEELNNLLEEYDNKILEYNKSINLINQEILEIENESTNIDDLLCQKNEVLNEIRKLENEYRILELSMNYLSKSQNILLEKYVRPMKNSVNKYVNILLDSNKEYSIDVNFNFKFVTKDGLKDIENYSKGYQAIISLCMRLALIDCLYPNEKPFVIFDDPFINFDDNKLKLCKGLIKDISKQYQIIYFTCHESRKI